MTLTARTVDLAKLNSATKYPSIPTYHTLDPKNGLLLDKHVSFAGTPAFATEKIDGTNARIVLLPDNTYVIGSREELLYGQGDLIENPALGIVPTVKPFADGIEEFSFQPHIVVIFGEVYGHKIGGQAKQYARSPVTGFRIFDIARFPPTILDWSRERIAAWRDGGGQSFDSVDELRARAPQLGVQTVPYLREWADGADLPTDHDGMLALLRELAPTTTVGLDFHEGRAEGIVFRSQRATIAKARFEDYERAARRAKAGAR